MDTTITTTDRVADLWACRDRRYLLVNTKTGELVRPGDTIVSFRGEEEQVVRLARGPEYNGTAKVQVADGMQYYDHALDLVALPLIEPGRHYTLDIVDRKALMRAWHYVEILAIGDDRTVTAVHMEDDGTVLGTITVPWSDVYIAEPETAR